MSRHQSRITTAPLDVILSANNLPTVNELQQQANAEREQELAAFRNKTWHMNAKQRKALKKRLAKMSAPTGEPHEQ